MPKYCRAPNCSNTAGQLGADNRPVPTEGWPPAAGLVEAHGPGALGAQLPSAPVQRALRPLLLPVALGCALPTARCCALHFLPGAARQEAAECSERRETSPACASAGGHVQVPWLSGPSVWPCTPCGAGASIRRPRGPRHRVPDAPAGSQGAAPWSLGPAPPGGAGRGAGSAAAAGAAAPAAPRAAPGAAAGSGTAGAAAARREPAGARAPGPAVRDEKTKAQSGPVICPKSVSGRAGIQTLVSGSRGGLCFSLGALPAWQHPGPEESEAFTIICGGPDIAVVLAQGPAPPTLDTKLELLDTQTPSV
ncbi:THAP domain-containing protein 8 isoform X1 [Camelus bactrianus]|uniref:THAP domain-containing protein 8 isoform X1 n=1 Tax=Camelus bactrianus TaxID=9837 RepID=A0AC58QYA3_CAMBA